MEEGYFSRLEGRKTQMRRGGVGSSRWGELVGYGFGSGGVPTVWGRSQLCAEPLDPAIPEVNFSGL